MENVAISPQEKVQQLFSRFYSCTNTNNVDQAQFFFSAGAKNLDVDEMKALSEEVSAFDTLWPGLGAIQLLKGHIAFFNENLDDAQKAYENAVSGQQCCLTNEGYECLFSLGVVHYLKGNYAAATEAFGQCARDKTMDYGKKIDQFYAEYQYRLSPLVAGIIQVFNKDHNSTGTGFIVASDGLMVTCAHVVKDSNVVMVRFYGEEQYYPVKVIKTDYRYYYDMALMRFDGPLPKRVKYLKLGSTHDVVGHTIYAYGFGSMVSLWAKGEVLGILNDHDQNVLQIKSTEIRYGFSGGPIWDDHTQEVIGIATRIMLPQAPDWRMSDIALATPAERIKAFIAGAVGQTGSGGCFVATAAFSDPACSVVQDLQKFRDDYLTNYQIGKKFIEVYYRCSPYLATKIANHEKVKWLIRKMLFFLTKFLPQRSGK